MACKYQYNNQWYSKEELVSKLSQENSNFKTLYQNLVNEITNTETGRKVLDRIKRDYVYKEDELSGVFKSFLNRLEQYNVDLSKTGDEQAIGIPLNYHEQLNISGKTTFDEIKKLAEDYLKNKAPKYTLEEQQEEAIVELVSLMTAEKLDKVKDGKLISLLKRLLKEMKQFVRSLINQKEIEIDKLPDNMTLGDLSDLLAYSNSKLILPGYEVEYTIGDGMKFKTYAEINNHIKELAKQADKYENVDLSKVEINKEDILLKRFLDSDKEYAQAREIINTWKNVNDIQYNPEEAYSRGQEFIHVHNAYGSTDTRTWLQNLIPNLEDINKAKGVMEMSFLTYYQGKLPNHVTRNLNEKAVIKIIAYPKSKDIAFASKIDNYTSSYSRELEGLQYFIDLSKVSKREQLAVSYTKSINLSNINTIEPNIADTIDDVAHHNEYAINIADGNFRIEYGEETSYDIKKLIDSINSILDQKYGKLVKPDTSKKILKSEKVYEVRWKSGGVITRTTDFKKAKIAMQGDYTDAEGNKLKPEDVVEIVEGSPIEQIGISPKITKETLKESIESVKRRNTSIKENQWAVEPVDENEFGVYTFMGVPIQLGFSTIEEANKWLKENKPKEKEYTSQALINTKIARLKEVAKKYPRSLIRSEVKRIENYENYVNVSGTKGLFDPDELPFQKIPNYLSKEQSDAIDNVFNENPELANAVYSALGYSQESDFKQTFKNSLWRGQAAKPKIDNEGNLILNPSYEQLSKDYGKSFTTQRFMAESYGGRYSNNPYLIEIDEDYISNIYNLQDEDVEGEKRIIGKEQIKIPKEKFNIIAPSFKKYENENVDDLIKSYIYNDGLANSMDEIVFGGEVSAIEGLDYTPTKVLLEVILKKLKTDFDGLLHYIAKKNIESIPENIDEYDGNIYDVYYFQDNSASDLVYSAMQKYNKNYVPNIVKYSENNQITPQQKQQATFIFSKFLNVYLQNFEQVERVLKEENVIEKDCTGKLKAEKGLQTNFTKGGRWKIYEIFEGKSHKQGGIDINIKNNQISFTNKNGSIKAKYGLVISKENKL